MEADFRSMMTTPVIFRRWTGTDNFGNVTWGQYIDAKCRIDSLNKTYLGGTVQKDHFPSDQTKSLEVITDITDPPYAPKDVAIFDLGTMIAHTVEIEYDEHGPHHQVLIGAIYG